MIGTTIDKYEVLQKVGEGGMATVYRGRHATLDREVAIKVLHPHLSSSTRNRKRFAREAKAIENLRHDHILEIYDYSGVDTGDCWIVTEFVDGETLTDLVQRVQRLPSEIACVVGIALADALAYAHAQGILHRDLKPDNVMIRRDGVVKLMDFGIARFLDETQVTMTGALVGSPAFMSPEQAREEELDARSDLFSLGTLLFFLVSGTLPFSGNNPSLILKNIIEGNRPAVTDAVPAISPSLADVVERLLAVRPEDRFPDAAAAGAALRACLDEVGFVPSEPRWSLARYLAEPDAVEAELLAFLVDALLVRARERLAAGDHLGGLRLVNRLLSLDETHAEALALLQGLHGVEARPEHARRWLTASAAVVLLATFGGLAARWATAQPPNARPAVVTPPDVETVALVEREPSPRPVPVVPAPEPPAEAPAAEPEPEPVTAAPEPTPPATPEPEAALADDAVAAVDLPPQQAPRPGRRAPPEPAPAPAKEPEPEPVDETPACIGFRTLAPADVLVDGRPFMNTRDPAPCVPLPPGTHTFLFTGPVTHDHTITLELAPGERRENVVVQLERRPVQITFPQGLPSSCVVLVDGESRGTLATWTYRLELEDPDSPHVVEVQCGERDARLVQRFERIDYSTVAFEGKPPP